MFYDSEIMFDYDYELSGSIGNLMKVQQTNTEKDCGILIDNQLSFCDHKHKIVSEADEIVGLIRRLICSLDKNIFMLLFKRAFRTFLFKIFFFETIVKQLWQFFRIFSHQF